MSNAILLRDAAERYTWLGLVVIPTKGKTPLVSWRDFVERFPADSDHFEWDRATGLAIVLGPATWQLWPHLWVLDAEAEHREAAERWLDAHVPDWRNGVTLETGSGGLHVYFLASRPVATHPTPWGEVRGERSICVVPPSRHPETGRPYRWLSERWTNLPALEPEQIPGYPAQGRSAGQAHEPLDVPSALAGVPLGQRNTTLFRLACKLRGLGLPQDWALKLVSEAAANCTPPWGTAPDEEPVEQLVSRVYRTYQPNPESIVSNEHSRDGDSEERPPARTPVRFTGRPVPPPRTWLVADFLPEGLPALLYGNGGSAKSYLALAIGLAVSAGIPWLGKPTVQRPVLYADYELDEAEQHRRARRLAAGLGLADVPEAFEYVQLADLAPRDAEDVLASWVLANPTGLVIVDSVGAAAVADPEKALAVVHAFRELRSLRPGGLLLIDHQAKLQAGQDYRDKTPFGSVYKFNLSRVVWQAELVANEPGTAWVLLRNTKNNLGPLHEEVGVQLSFEPDRITAVVVSLTSGPLLERASLESRILAVLADGPATAQEIADTLEAKLDSVKAKLSRLKALGRVVVVETVGREYRWGLPSEGTGAPAPTTATPAAHTGHQSLDRPGTNTTEPAASLTLTPIYTVNVNDDPEFRDIPHHEAKIGGHETVGQPKRAPTQLAASLTLTPYMSVNVNDVNDDPEFRDISHHEAKIGGHGNGAPPVVGQNPHETNEIGGHDAGVGPAFARLPHETSKIGGHGCLVCGKPVVQWGGRVTKYCSDACRKRAARHRSPAGQPTEPTTNRTGDGPANDLVERLLAAGNRAGWPLLAARLAELAAVPWRSAKPVLQTLLDNGTLVSLHGDRQILAHTMLRPADWDRQPLADRLVAAGDDLGWPAYAGHIAQRAGVCWGLAEAALQALVEARVLMIRSGPGVVLPNTLLDRAASSTHHAA